MKKFLALLIGIAVAAGSGTSVGAADIPDEQWVKSGPTATGGSWGINTADGVESPAAYLTSTKADNYDPGTGKTISVSTCSSFEESICPHNEYQYFETPLSFCANPEDFDCVADILASKEDGSKLDYKFVRHFPESNKYAFKGDKNAKLPNSGYSVVVDIPGAPHSGGSLYLINAVLAGHRFPSEKTFTVDRMYVDLKAVTFSASRQDPPRPILDVSKGSSFMSVNRAGDPKCSIQCSSTENAVAQKLPLDVKFGVHIRLNAAVSGWLNGRVSKVESRISKDANGMQNVIVTGYPVQVPIVFGWVQKSTAPQALKDLYGAMSASEVNSGNGYGKCLDPSKLADAPNGPCNPVYWESVLRFPQKNARDMKELATWLPVLEDTAIVAPTYWNINATDSNLYQNCVSDASVLLGVVTTNASSFVSGPPIFNKSEGILDYQVLAPHYLSDKSIFQGTYDLAIKSDFARCIYGFTSAPVNARVSIISADGTNQVATVVTSESNGWIHLGAYGFTFSSPTVRVKLTQESLPTPQPEVTTQAPQKSKITITCVKGKSIKKIASTNPKCPTGYKKKATK